MNVEIYFVILVSVICFRVFIVCIGVGGDSFYVLGFRVILDLFLMLLIICFGLFNL